MANLNIRSTLEKYLDVSDEIMNLFQNFIFVWKERGTDIDVIEARKIYLFMIKEDQKRARPQVTDVLFFDRHSWVVGEYAAGLTQKLLDKHPDFQQRDLPFSPPEMEYAGGSHDIAKLLLKENYQYAHEHMAYLLFKDNGCSDLASLAQPHQPGEETVLKMLHEAGDFLDLTETEFCHGRIYPFASDLIMLADMSCGINYVGPNLRMNDIRARYSENTHLVRGINDSEKGEKRILALQRKIHQLLI